MRAFKSIRSVFVKKDESSSPASQYQYSQIKDTVSDIRLLTLLPRSASQSDAIHILINPATLNKTSRPDYEALSYAWGNPENPVIVYVGVRRKYFLEVTRNLADALIHLRHETDNRVLWIDAICIDQQNLQERSQQVDRMADIYQMARRVTAWLGPGDAQTKMAMAFLGHLSTRIEVDWARSIIKPSQQATNYGDEDWANTRISITYTQEEARAIFTLFSRPWFERLWIRQEIWLGGTKAWLACGNDTLSWIDFRKSVYCLYTKDLRLHGHQENLEKLLKCIFDLCNSDGYKSLMKLLNASRNAKCSDPRDRVYGILSLIDPGDKIDLRPDYTKTALEVYKAMTLRFIDQNSSLDILKCCHLDKRHPHMPTWVPNLMTKSTANYLVNCKAGGYSRCCARAMNEKTLKVTGRRISTVKEVYCISSKYVNRDLDIISVRKLAPPHLDKIYLDGSTAFDAFCRVIAGSNFSDLYMPHLSSLLDFELSKIALAKFLDASQSITILSESESRYLNYITHNLRNFQLIITHDGYMGLGSAAAQAGDQICVFLGMESLALLRSHPSQSDRYEFVGEAAIQGLINAEGLLGPLPKQYRAVNHFSPIRNSYFCGFLNLETEKWQPDDPRLGELPKGWIKKEHPGDGYFNQFVNEETGEDLEWGDPRMTAEELTKQGVELEEFYLV